MHIARLNHEADTARWRDQARQAIAQNIAPNGIIWRVGEAAEDLLAGGFTNDAATAFKVPRKFIALAEEVLLHREAERFSLMYRLLWRIRMQSDLLDDAADPDVHLAERLAKQVHRDIHKMHAFVRFKEVQSEADTLWLAWFEPDHHILAAAIPHFVDRFASMRWSIFTPERSASWTGNEIVFGPGATRDAVPEKDRLDAHWLTYYRSIFNPARLKLGAMVKEMPKRYWRNLPESVEIPALVRSAGGRTQSMISASVSAPSPMTAAEARRRAGANQSDTARAADLNACRRCPIGAMATQAVLGEGPRDAALMLVGEQPGDQEDLAGHPFVGPAGQILDEALKAAGLDRLNAYVTNAVKHFKFEARGKRRLHRSPSAGEIDHCRWWLNEERAAVRPRLIIALGSSAARGITGRSVAIGRARGTILPLDDGAHLLVTVHPSYLLRIQDPALQAQERQKFTSDLALGRNWLAQNA